jgi:hypothetical protein
LARATSLGSGAGSAKVLAKRPKRRVDWKSMIVGSAWAEPAADEIGC